MPQVLHHTIDETSPLYPPPPEDAAAEGPAAVASTARDGDYKDVDRDPDARRLRGFRDRVAQHILASGVELLVTLDAIDPLTGSAFQARYSYTADDLAWDHTFAPCLCQAADGSMRIDWDSFHSLCPVPFNGEASGESRHGSRPRTSASRADV